MNKNLDLQANKARLENIARGFYDSVTQLPQETRPDENQRTGITVVMREIGTRNLFFTKIYEPSEASQFFVSEKMVRSATFGHAASKNSEDPADLQFEGSITYVTEDGRIFQASISGLQAPEDAFGAIVLMSNFIGVSFDDVVKNIEEHGGKLSDCITQKDHYLHSTI